MLEADIAFGNQISEATLRRSRRRRSRRRRVAAAAALDREEPESEDEGVKRADGHLDRDEQIVTGGLSGADRIPKVQERKKKDMRESCGV